MAQLIHAAGESSPGNLPNNTHAVALEAENEVELQKLELRLQNAKIDFVAIREVDQPYNNQLMAIGLRPQVRDKNLRRMLSRFALVR